ncbi:hypothetical protein TNCV_316441 [Trichonephila clavipes]|nr:hypothetical protein TNCV_316441 [Trichonephila clavipes]
MDSLGHSTFPPVALGRQDDEETTPGVIENSMENKRTDKRQPIIKLKTISPEDFIPKYECMYLVMRSL